MSTSITSVIGHNRWAGTPFKYGTVRLSRHMPFYELLSQAAETSVTKQVEIEGGLGFCDIAGIGR